MKKSCGNGQNNTTRILKSVYNQMRVKAIVPTNERNRKMGNNGFVTLVENKGFSVKEDEELAILHFPKENALIRQFKDGTLTEFYSFNEGKVWVYEDGAGKLYNMDDYCEVEVCNLDNGGATEMQKLSENEKLREKYIQMLINGDV